MPQFMQVENGQIVSDLISGENLGYLFQGIPPSQYPTEYVLVQESHPTAARPRYKLKPKYTLSGDVIIQSWEEVPQTEQEIQAYTEQATASIRVRLNALLTQTLNFVSQETEPDAKAALEAYADQLRTCEIPDVYTFKIPQPPKIMRDGRVFATTASGSAPNVIE